MKRPTEKIGPTKFGSYGIQNAHAYGTTRRVLHDCERCGFERVVKFVPYMRRDANEQLVEVGGRCGSSHCKACDFELNEIKYRGLARVNSDRAIAERRKQRASLVHIVLKEPKP